MRHGLHLFKAPAGRLFFFWLMYMIRTSVLETQPFQYSPVFSLTWLKQHTIGSEAVSYIGGIHYGCANYTA